MARYPAVERRKRQPLISRCYALFSQKYVRVDFLRVGFPDRLVAMASLRAPHLWCSGLQVELRENNSNEYPGGRISVYFACKRHQASRTSILRRSRRVRHPVKPYGSSIKACNSHGACKDFPGVRDHTKAVDVVNTPLQQACRLLRLEVPNDLQDLIASLILSECVYKKLELDEQRVADKIAESVSAFPPGWVQLKAVQLSLAGIPQHYLIATSSTSMYVAFMGTKQFQDILADANLLHTPVWAESARLAADRQVRLSCDGTTLTSPPHNHCSNKLMHTRTIVAY